MEFVPFRRADMAGEGGARVRSLLDKRPVQGLDPDAVRREHASASIATIRCQGGMRGPGIELDPREEMFVEPLRL